MTCWTRCQAHPEDRIGGFSLRSLASTAVKAALGAATKNKGLGLLAFYLLSAANQPDLLRPSLPAEFSWRG